MEEPSPFSPLFPPFSYRTLQAADLAAVFAIERESFPHPWTWQMLEAELSKKVAFNRVLVENETLIAYAFAHCIIDELHILTVAVHPDHRRKGYASAILEGMLEEVSARGATLARLEVRSGNIPALELYTRLGFQRIGSRAGYYSDNGEDAILFGKPLKPRAS